MKTLKQHINEALKISKNLSEWSAYSCQPTTKDELIVEVEGKAYGDSYAVWKEWKLKDGEPTEGGYSGDTSKSRIDDLMKKLGKENLKKLKRISLKESYD